MFSKSKANVLPPYRSYDHKIPLIKDTKLPFGPIYSLSTMEMNSLKDYLNEMIEKGFIRASSSPIGSPVLFVKKKDGTLRLCVDYRALNAITVRNRYPLPLINNLLDQLSTAKIFSKLDLRGAYNLIRIAKGEEWKTSFRTRYGAFEYLVMPFGLMNAPATFQNFMNDVFREYLDRFMIVYLDDILIYSSNISEHVGHVKLVLDRLKQNNLFAKLEKCVFHAPSLEFLGYVISNKGISMDKNKVEVIVNWPVPSSIKALQSFLGFGNFYRRFIASYSSLARPLFDLLKKNAVFEWNNECKQAFAFLKKAFSSAPVLAYYQNGFQCVLETDASDFAIAAVLSQFDKNKQLHPVAFYSRTMLEAERNYEIYDKELLAICAAFKEWRSYLQGTEMPILVLTDHNSYQY